MDRVVKWGIEELNEGGIQGRNGEGRLGETTCYSIILIGADYVKVQSNDHHTCDDCSLSQLRLCGN